MRRVAFLGLIALLPGCAGTGQFLSDTFTLPPANPNLPQADSLNMRRAMGQSVEVDPLEPEPGNVWPDQSRREPTLQDLQRDPNAASRDGFEPTEVPGRTPGLPAGEQPRPRGSSTPPGNVQPPPGSALPGSLPPGTVPPNAAQPPRALSPAPSGPRRDPTGSATPLPDGGFGVDSGGTRGYRQLNTPRGPGAIVVPNGNGTSTVISPDGSVQTIPTPR